MRNFFCLLTIFIVLSILGCGSKPEKQNLGDKIDKRMNKIDEDINKLDKKVQDKAEEIEEKVKEKVK